MRSCASCWALVAQQLSQWQDTNPRLQAARCSVWVAVVPTPRLTTRTMTFDREAAGKFGPLRLNASCSSGAKKASSSGAASPLRLQSALVGSRGAELGIAHLLGAGGCFFLSLAARAAGLLEAGAAAVVVETTHAHMAAAAAKHQLLVPILLLVRWSSTARYNRRYQSQTN